MQIDKLKERNQGNLKALDNAQSSLRSMIGPIGSKDNSVAARIAVLKVLDYLKESIPVDRDCSSLNDAKEFLNGNGIPNLKYKLEGKWWKKASGPLLCTKEDGMLCALIPTAFGYSYQDENSGRKMRVNARNASRFGCDAISVIKPLPKRSLALNDLYKFILESVPFANRVSIIIFCIIATLLNMLIPVANKILFKEVIPSGSFREILPICALLLGAGFSSVLYSICNNVVLLRAKDKVNASVQPALMSRLLFLPSKFFKSFSSADLSMRVLSVSSAYQLLTAQILTVFMSSIFAIMYVIIAFAYAKSMVWVVSFVVIFAFVMSYFETKASIEEYNRKLPISVQTHNFSQSAIAGIQKIKNNRAEARVFAQWAMKFSRSEVKSADSSFFMKYKKGFGTAVLVIGPLLAYITALRTNIALSDYIAFMSAFGIMLNSIDNGRRTLDTIARISPQLKLLTPILEAEPEFKSGENNVDLITGSIDVNHITFFYDTKSPKTLDDVSIHIPAGQSVGLVGSSGCGKSTLMRIIMGFEKPSSGSVYYGQYNVFDVNIAQLRQFIGYCPQNLQIFPATIEDNIRMGYSDYSEEDIWEAAEAACIAEDIRRMPEKLQTVLGEGGSGLSGGQCQRLLLARALLNKPKVLFLDEATSALDNITQKRVMENIDNLGCTRIMIAHRLSTVMNCDRIIAIDKGKIVEDGSPQQLLEKKGFFYELSKRQM